MSKSSKPKYRGLRMAWRLFVLALFVGGWALAAAALHVVVVPGDGESAVAGDWKVLVLPKNRMTFQDTWADTRAWDAGEARQHDDLIARLVEAGHSQHMDHLLAPDVSRRLEDSLKIRRSVLASGN